MRIARLKERILDPKGVLVVDEDKLVVHVLKLQRVGWDHARTTQPIGDHHAIRRHFDPAWPTAEHVEQHRALTPTKSRPGNIRATPKATTSTSPIARNDSCTRMPPRSSKRRVGETR